MNERLERRIGSLRFQNPLVFGAGSIKILSDVAKAVNSAAAGAELGGITPEPRSVPQEPTFYARFGKKGDLLFTLNSRNLGNPGKSMVSEWAPVAIEYAHKNGKLLEVNVSADTVVDLLDMITWGIETGFDWVTINAGCPNKWKEVNGVARPQGILSFDPEGITALVAALDERHAGCGTEVWWKPSPDNDTLGSWRCNADIVARSRTITGWVANNTVPHSVSFDWDTFTEAIKPGGGYAGMAGPAVMPKALGDIRRLLEEYGDRFARIGAGGVTNGEDVDEYLMRGADIVQFTSAFWAESFDYKLPGRILEEYAEREGIEFE